MSENQSNSQEQENPVPEAVRELQQVLADLASYRSVVRSAQIPGTLAESAHKLSLFLNESYAQILKQFNEHPYVVQVRAEEQAKLDASSQQ